MEIIIEGVTAKAFLNIIGELKDYVTGYYFDNDKKLYTVYLSEKKNWIVCTYTYVTTLRISERTQDSYKSVILRNKDFANMIIQ